MPKEDVVAGIEVAFADTPYPGSAFEDISATQDDEGIVEYFRGTNWHGHGVQDLRRRVAAMSFFTDKAFRYWLPAFMLAELENPLEADVIAEGIAFHLTGSRADSRLQQFPQDELEAITLFLAECWERYHEMLFQDAEQSVHAHIVKA